MSFHYLDMNWAFKQANRPGQAFKKARPGPKKKPMTGNRPGLGFKIMIQARPGLSKA